MTDVPEPALGSTSWKPWADEQEQLSDVARAQQGLPAHAGTRTRRYDPAISIYNLKASNTRRLRAALGAAAAGTGLCRVFFAGDSVTGGTGATRGTSDPVTYAKAEFVRLGYTTGEIINGWTNGIAEPRITLSGGADGGNGGSANTTFPYLLLRASAQALTFACSAGTVVEILSTQSSGTFTYSIDAATAVTVTGDGSVGMRRTTITGLANTTHSVKLTSTSASSVYIYGVGTRGTSGVVLENGGISGSTSADWNSNPFSGTAYGPGWSAFSTTTNVHDCVVIELGLNDFFQSLTTASLTTNLNALVDQARLNGATVMLAASQYQQGADTTWPPYLSAIYDAADTKDVPLIDFGDRFGLFTQYNADGFTYDEAFDTIHLTPAGYMHKMRAWMQALRTA